MLLAESITQDVFTALINELVMNRKQAMEANLPAIFSEVLCFLVEVFLLQWKPLLKVTYSPKLQLSVLLLYATYNRLV
jgi:hypothetical protein